MYDYITGKVALKKTDTITIDVGGVGYKIYSPPSTIELLQEKGMATVYVSFVIREYSQVLYGFSTESERDLFELLLNISGIGPKIALSIVSNASSNDLVGAIIRKDTAFLCKIPGIGKKTAERMLLELKDSITIITTSAYQPKNQIALDAISALINLGYSQASAERAVSKTIEKQKSVSDLSELITLSLMHSR